MDKALATKLLTAAFANQTTDSRGKHSLTTVQVHRTRGGTTHHLFLIAEDCGLGYGTRVFNATAAVAAALGVKFDRKTGGIPASQYWVTVLQVRQLAEMFGIEIMREGW